MGLGNECEISVDRHEELGTRFLRLLPLRGMSFNDRFAAKQLALTIVDKRELGRAEISSELTVAMKWRR